MTATKKWINSNNVPGRVMRWDLLHRSSSGAQKNRRGMHLYDSDGNFETATAFVLWPLSVGDTVQVEYKYGTARCDDAEPCVLSAFRLN